jgi:hypothetical protein
VTVIATGFGGQRRRRARATADAIGPVPTRPSPREVSDTLDVPSFLRDE